MKLSQGNPMISRILLTSVLSIYLIACGGADEGKPLNENTDIQGNLPPNEVDDSTDDSTPLEASDPLPEAMACTGFEPHCGTWKRVNSANVWLDIKYITGVNYQYTETPNNTCHRDPSLSFLGELGAIHREWTDFNEMDSQDKAKLFLSSLSLDGNNTLTQSFTLFGGDESRDFTDEGSIPTSCLNLPYASPIAIRASKESDMVGSWIGSRLPYATSPDSGHAFIFRANGSVTIFNEFELNDQDCEDWEIEGFWKMATDGKLSISRYEDFLYDDDYYVYKAMDDKLVLHNGPEPANQLARTELTEQELRSQCADQF